MFLALLTISVQIHNVDLVPVQDLWKSSSFSTYNQGLPHFPLVGAWPDYYGTSVGLVHQPVQKLCCWGKNVKNEKKDGGRAGAKTQCYWTKNAESERDMTGKDGGAYSYVRVVFQRMGERNIVQN